MTDDRARRIRNLRNRTADRGGDDDSEEASDDAGADGEDAAETGEPVKTDGNGDEASADGADETPEDDERAAESPSSEADETTGDADDSSMADDADDVELEYSDDEPADAATDDPSGEESDDAVPADDRAQEPAGPRDGDEASPASGSGPAETTVAAATETTVPGPAAGAGTGGGLKPMVETADVSDSPFGGAIASDDVLSDFVDDVGTGEADAIGAGAEGVGAAGRNASVFDRDDSLVATTHDDDTIQMLEFYLNDDRYAIEIERISAIVEMKRITRFPRGPEAIDGVTDLRGEITAVLDPTAMLDVERNDLSEDQYIVVLERDDDKQKLGFRVTDVLQAVTYRQSQIDETASVMDAAGDQQHEFINGIVKKTTDGRTELVTWLDVDAIIENTE